MDESISRLKYFWTAGKTVTVKKEKKKLATNNLEALAHSDQTLEKVYKVLTTIQCGKNLTSYVWSAKRIAQLTPMI